MNASKILGIVTAVSGAGLLVLALAGGVAAAAGGMVGHGAVPGGFSNGAGTGFMGGMGTVGQGGMGPGMMSSTGMGPGVMGSGHMNGWGGTTTPDTTSATIPGAPEVRVTASEFTLAPAQIVLPAGGAVNLTLENRGALPHDLTIPALGVRIAAAAGQTQTVGLRDLPAGTYPAYCGVPGHADAGMRATVVVR